MPAAAVSSLPDPYQSAASSIQSRPQPSNKRRFRGAGSRWPAAARREVLQFPWRPPRWRWVFELAEAGAREGRSGGHHLRAEQAGAACAPLPPSRTSGVCDAAAARAGLLESWCACLWWCPLGVGENWATGLRRRDEEEAVHVRTPGFLTPLSACPQPRSRRALVAAVAGKCSPGPSLPSPPLASEARSGSAAHRLTKLHQFFFLPVGIICRSWAGKMDDHLFEDAFNVTTRIDPDGKKVARVNRIEAKSEQLNMMHLHVATDLYPMHVGHKFIMVLAPTLNDGTPDTGFYTQAGWKILAGKHDYVMIGKLYKISRTTVMKDLLKSDE